MKKVFVLLAAVALLSSCETMPDVQEPTLVSYAQVKDSTTATITTTRTYARLIANKPAADSVATVVYRNNRLVAATYSRPLPR